MTLIRKNAYLSIAVGVALLALILFLLIVGYAQIKSAQKRAKDAEAGSAIHVLVASPFPRDYVERIGGAAIEVVMGPFEKSSLFQPNVRASLAATKVVFAVEDGPDLDDAKPLLTDATFVYWIDENDSNVLPKEGFASDVKARVVAVRKIEAALSQAAPDSAPYFADNARKLLEELGEPSEEATEEPSETPSTETAETPES